MSSFTTKIPGFAALRGSADDEIAQFQNVPYGKIEKRFSPPSAIVEDLGELDCTRQGPLCPQIKPYDDDWNGVKPENCKPIDLVYDEFNCLNMLITIPAKVDPSQPVPVVIWLHGGGNNAGTAYRGSNDPANWVRRGCIKRRPFIVVTPQFRLNVFGFLPHNGVGNWGLMDQKLCIEWVHRHIHHLGGDPTRITLCGQSAGAACALAQSQIEDPLFQQAAYLSGSLRVEAPRTLADYKVLTKALCNHINCTEKDLGILPWEILVEATAALGIEIYPFVDDGVFLPHGAFKSAPRSVPRIILSDCAEDGFYFKSDQKLAGIIADAVPDSIYPRPSAPKDVCEFMTTYIFSQGTQLLYEDLQQSSVRVFRQLFDAVNPIDPTCGNNHMVELHYILGYYQPRAEFSALIEEVQKTWTALIYFETPWDVESEILYVTSTEPSGANHLPSRELAKLRDVEAIHRLKGHSFVDLWRYISGWLNI